MNFFKTCIAIILALLWFYLLHLTKKSEVHFWHFIIGSIGMFLFLMICLEPVIMPYINLVLTSMISVFGNVTGWFTTFYNIAAIFITTGVESGLLQIDVECSGVIEILAYLSILTFFDPFDRNEKVVYGIGGVVYIFLANTIRVCMISSLVHLFGFGIYDFAHTILGRLVFYILTVIMYYYVFTRPQIARTKIREYVYSAKGDNHE